MTLNAKTALVLVGAICFFLGAGNVPGINWTSAGFGFVALSFVVP